MFGVSTVYLSFIVWNRVQVLGTPSQEDILGMNPNYNEFRFPQIKSHPWSEVFTDAVDADAVDLISGLLKYSPTRRCTCLEAMGHPFFEEILRPGCTLPNGALMHQLARNNWSCRITACGGTGCYFGMD
jgi:kinase